MLRPPGGPGILTPRSKGTTLTRQILIVALASFGLTQLTSLATSIYLHRALAHHSLSLRPALALAFRTIVWMLTGQSQQHWVAVHSKHQGPLMKVRSAS
jgi:fatty-acid desaturase